VEKTIGIQQKPNIGPAEESPSSRRTKPDDRCGKRGNRDARGGWENYSAAEGRLIINKTLEEVRTRPAPTKSREESFLILHRARRKGKVRIRERIATKNAPKKKKQAVGIQWSKIPKLLSEVFRSKRGKT